MNFIANMTAKQKRRYEIIIAVILLFVMFEIRAFKLDADPPIGLSYSTDVYTDPAQYTLFAKQKILTDDLNPYNETRFTFFVKSSVTLLALLIFKLFGVSLLTSNLVGLFYSFGALLLFYLILRKVANPITGIIYLLLIALNYNQLFYGRLPFLEHAMTFYAFLSFTLLVYCTRMFWVLCAGVLLAVGIFFGKVIGVVFMAPFVGYFVYQAVVENKKNSREIIYFSVGFLSLTVFWFLYSYLPMQQQVASYVGEQAFSLYGAPEALESFDSFLWKYLSFGNDSRLFTRMRIPWVLAAIFLSMFSFRFFNNGTLKEKFCHFSSGQFFIILLIVSFYGALMIWNYRPLRYQLVLIYPVYGAASIILGMFYSKIAKIENSKTSFLYLPLIFIIFFPLTYQFYNWYVLKADGLFFYDDYKLITTGYTVLVTILLYGAVIIYRKYQHLPNKYFRYLIPIIVIIAIYSVDYKLFMDWAERPTFTARDNSLNLEMILSENAVVSGPFGGSLTIENNIGTIIHMFGVSSVDSSFFVDRPITHLLVDNGNESQAKEDYPSMMDSAKLIITYHVGLQNVRLYRIAGFTGNSVADNYKLSRFEQLIEQYDDGKGMINNELAVDILTENSDNIACYVFLAEASEQDSIYELSELMFKKAVEFSPTNYNLNARVAKFYQDRYNQTNSELYKIESKHYYEEAIKFAPTVSKLKKKLAELHKKKTVDNDTDGKL